MATAKAVRTRAVDFYNTHAEEYGRSTVVVDMSRVYERFLSELAPGSHILDAGCGSGRDTKAFLDRGYVVTAFDGSPQMASFASRYTGQECLVLRFQDVEFHEKFDGIWACASLLHVPKREMKDVYVRLVAALKPGGVMYASFIAGDGVRVSQDGRLYSSYTAKSLREMLKETPAVLSVAFWHSDEIPSSVRRAPWLNSLLRKAVRSGQR